MPTQPFQKVIRDVAREVLAPAGIIQKGRSRFWTDDCAWYVICIEFQPSSARKGSYTDVGLTWLWYPKDYFSYDIGGRLGDFIEYRDDAGFRTDFSAAARLALQEAQRLKSVVRTPSDAVGLIAAGRSDRWSVFHRAVATALAGQKTAAVGLFEQALVADATIAYEKDRNAMIDEMLKRLDRGDFRPFIEAQIAQSRTLLKLPEMQGPYLP